MTHLQLRRKDRANACCRCITRQLYFIGSGETKTCSSEAAASDLKGQIPFGGRGRLEYRRQISASGKKAAVALNEDAQVSHWP